MKRKKTIEFLLVTLFAGVLLTCAITVGFDSVFKASESETSFNDTFRRGSRISDFVKYVDYKVFGHISSEELLIGRDDWLFEAVDSENGYERLLDYIGGNTFSDEELEKIAAVISGRAEAYAAEGIEYMMIVIPDSITVCSDNVPWYLGKQSENTRLSQVSAYIAEKKIEGFINPTSAMILESSELVMYNNTENSINAYGAYCIYNTVVSRFLAETGREVDRIYREDVDFYTRLTDGKKIAKNAGISEVVKNRTVSISDGMTDEYSVVYNDKNLMITVRDEESLYSFGECVVLEYSDDWDRIQLMPYFSNTFGKVYYRADMSEQPSFAKQYGATLAVQIIHESELETLLE